MLPGKFLFLAFDQTYFKFTLFLNEPLQIKTRQGNDLSQLVGWLLPQVRPWKLEKLQRCEGHMEEVLIPVAVQMYVSALLVCKSTADVLH